MSKESIEEHARTVQSLATLEGSGALTRVGLTLPSSMTYDQYEAVGRLFRTWNETMKWAMGDWLLAGEALFGEDAYQASEELGLSVGQRQQYLRIAQRIPIARRRPELTWSHHRSVAALDPADQDRWLAEAVKKGWTKAQMEEAIRALPAGAAVAPPQDTPDPPFVYVVERVANAAERVWAAAQPADAEHYMVDAGPMRDLALALGRLLPGEVEDAADDA